MQLLQRYLLAHKNTHRLARKPIPKEKKEEFGNKARHFAQYVQAQTLLVDQERATMY
jgi:hypothetical protein